MKEEIEFKLTGTSINDWTITDCIILLLIVGIVVIAVTAIIAMIKHKKVSTIEHSSVNEDDQLDTLNCITSMTNIETVKTNIETISHNIKINH